ncbi:MAG: enoyl-CoA hydratase/isomerase family protein [Proteobacteria bacterium]|nr:enoyl-CoA hydratase/isomerase family protein [Pseudomonadota bacterium]
MTETVLLDVAEGIATITLNRPAALNAVNLEMMAAFVAAVARIEGDPAARCVVIRGAGDHFMAGGDIKQFHGRLSQTPEARSAHFRQTIHNLHPAIVTLRRMPKPVVASLKGAAAGFGLSLALAADLAIAAEDAYFTLAYCRIGTSPDGGSTFHLPRIVGLRKAMEIALLGERFDAETARELGIVNWVVPTAALEEETAKLAGRLARGPSHALGETKRLLNAAFDNRLEAQLAAEAEAFAGCAATADFAEGVSAFVEKRAANFQGK